MASEETLKKALRARVAARGWVTRAYNNLCTALEQEDIGKIELEDIVEEFDKRLDSFDIAQCSVEENIEMERLEEDIQQSAEFRERMRRPRVEACKRLAELSKNLDIDQKSDNSSHTAHSVGGSTVRLPKLELPKFSGHLTEWQPFWDKFTALVDDSELPAISKFSYLQSLLTGEAKAVIQGLALTASNYSVACKLLAERFGRPERIIFAHIQALLNVTMPPKSASVRYVTNLWKIQDELLTHIRSLEALGVKGDQYGLFLTPVILSRLPHDIRLEWSREGSGHESDLKWLLKFLQREIERRDRSESFKDVSASKPDNRNTDIDRRKFHTSTTSALQSSSNIGNICVFCERSHPSEKCWDILKLSISNREDRIRSEGLCFRCLRKGHIARNCKVKCSKCKGRHNVLCCKESAHAQSYDKHINMNDNQNAKSNNDSSLNTVDNDDNQFNEVTTCSVSNVKHVNLVKVKSTFTVLQTAKVEIYGKQGIVNATLMFDTGSDRSYVSSEFVKRVKPDWVSAEPITYSAFGGGKSPKGSMRNIFDLKIKCKHGESQNMLAVEVPVICSPLYRPKVPSKVLSSLGITDFADEYDKDRQITVDILVGLDYYWTFIKSDRVCCANGLVAQDSVFGWVLSGSCGDNTVQRPRTDTQLLCLENMSDSTLRAFWDLESIGIVPKEMDCDNQSHVLKQFTQTVKFVNGRYEVALPWKSEDAKNKLLNNEMIAKKRLNSLTNRLEKDPVLKEKYNCALHEFEINDMIEEVPFDQVSSSNPVFYMPHHPVVKESSVTTKVRPVFDASAVDYNGLSLNDCMEIGPCLLPDLVAILVRFRRWKVALTADITKAFLQIQVRPEDRDAHRFLWNCDGRVRCMRFLRVPFGNKSSPFLLNATIKHHLSTFPPSKTVAELESNLYVDDWLSGADTDIDACNMFDEACGIMSAANMRLAKCASNSKVVSDKFSKEFGMSYGSETVKVLGLKWLSVNDCFLFDGVELPGNLEMVSSKRVVLSILARFFDPLGFLNPFTMTAKILFQEIWRLGLEWDERLPDEVHVRFMKWVAGISILKQWHISRCYTSVVSWSHLSDCDIELHAFGDASLQGYGACVYLRLSRGDGSFENSLVISKAKVAPLKKVTLPRLELLGSLLCARLLRFVQTALNLSDKITFRCWSDSQVVLSWIKGDANKWKPFVANRVREIQELTPPSCWFHCVGKDNPADLITRGVSAKQLMTATQWLNGPHWLTNDLSEKFVKVGTSVTEFGEFVKEELTCVSINSSSDISFEFERWGTFVKSMRIFAWMLRFIKNMKSSPNDRQLGELSFVELSEAKVMLFYTVQRSAFSNEFETLKRGKSIPKQSKLNKLDPFIGDDGLMRVKGRLQLSDLSYESKHPIILPACHIARLLVMFQHVHLKHAGVSTLIATLRSAYWIIGLRRIVKRVCRECIPCRKLEAKACSQPAAPLPDLRVKSAPPFTVTGLDFAGPLYCLNFPKVKFYILLFTCAVVRAVHLELTDSLSLDDCLLAVRRFTARRGLPSVFYSDNAKTFIGMASKLKVYFGPLSPEWKFIVPRSPWWGGWWERLVRSVKTSLRKTIGANCLTRKELETTLLEVESCINSRPLTFLGDDVDSSIPLTPSHFLIGRTAGFRPEVSGKSNISVSAADLGSREAARQSRLNEFWTRWSDDYLRNLPPVVQGFVSSCNLEKGSVVLIREDNVKRLSWPIAVVVELFVEKMVL